MRKKSSLTLIFIVLIGLAIVLNFDRLSLLMAGEESTKFTVDGDTAVMTGVINSKTITDVENLIKDHPNVTTIIMKDVPGSMDDLANLEASRLVRAHGFNTYVPGDGIIASGGTDFFCAGVKRTIEDGAQIGVHSWGGDGIEDASTLPKDHVEHKKYLDYYKEMGIPEDFYWFTIKAAPASDIHMMSKGELETYRLATE